MMVCLQMNKRPNKTNSMTTPLNNFHWYGGTEIRVDIEAKQEHGGTDGGEHFFLSKLTNTGLNKAMY